MSRLIVQKSGRHYPKNYHRPMVIEAMFTLTEEFFVQSVSENVVEAVLQTRPCYYLTKSNRVAFALPTRVVDWGAMKKLLLCGFRRIARRKWSLRSDLGFNKDLTRKGGIQARLLRSGPPTGTRMNVLQATDAPIWLESFTPIKSPTSCSCFPKGLRETLPAAWYQER